LLSSAGDAERQACTDAAAPDAGDFAAVDLGAILGHACDAIIGLDADGRVDAWNTRALEVFGWSRSEVLGRSLTDLIIPAAHREAHRHGLARFNSTRRGAVINRTVEITALRRDGTEFPIELTIWASPDDNGRSRFNGLVRDITARAATQAQLARQAFHDHLTGLPNRALFLDRLGQALARRGGDDERTAVLVLDLDDFKTVNDSLGHAAGDDLLRQVAGRLSAGLRPVDTLARLAGDEFAFVLQDMRDPGEAAAVAERLCAALTAPFDLEGRQTYVGSSIGIALSSPDAGAGVTDLLRDADMAMYAAKAGGGHGFAFFDPGMHRTASRRLELKADLQRAVERGELVVHYQPILNLCDGTLAGLEALVRWQHPERGLVPPDDFIPLAEETGLIRGIDSWVLREACSQLAAWRRARPGLEAVRVNVNISARDLADAALPDDVLATLASTGLPAANLMLEVTESALAADVAVATERLAALKARGVSIALDDFGTGYCSLTYLQNFPLDRIKIDRSFVWRLDGVGDRGLARLVVDIGHGLGLEVTPRPRGDGRGCGDRRAARPAPGDGLRPRPGLPLLAAAPARGGDGTPAPRQPRLARRHVVRHGRDVTRRTPRTRHSGRHLALAS
jgi:diguanylate cyclase (GGDEF)-like protein/PAS domain S-box-containing protein